MNEVAKLESNKIIINEIIFTFHNMYSKQTSLASPPTTFGRFADQESVLIRGAKKYNADDNGSFCRKSYFSRTTIHPKEHNKSFFVISISETWLDLFMADKSAY